MKNKKNILITTGLIVIASALTFIVTKMAQPRTGYVDLVLVYNEFSMKKELDNKLQTIQSKRQAIVDSLTLSLNMLAQKADLTPPGDTLRLIYEQQRRYVVLQQQQYVQDNNATAQAYQDEIWKQINQYVSEYGKEQGYSYIFGGDGSGSVMYTQEENDLTSAVTSYVNTKYSGK